MRGERQQRVTPQGNPHHRDVRVNGIGGHIGEKDEGPLVVLLHGFPETWYSWRHQIDALAAAGYRTVAPTSAATAPAIAPRRSTSTRPSTSSAMSSGWSVRA